jgi:hypothetical protein
MVLDAALAVPQDLFIIVGVCEFLGGVGLIMPAMTGVQTEAHAVASGHFGTVSYGPKSETFDRQGKWHSIVVSFDRNSFFLMRGARPRTFLVP